jgi:hypothetical protein
MSEDSSPNYAPTTDDPKGGCADPPNKPST